MPPKKGKPPTRRRSRSEEKPPGKVAPGVETYRHKDLRKNIPPAGLAAHGKVVELPRSRYSYDPHLPPVLRFDETGKEDRLPELLEESRHRSLTDDEAHLLREALRNHEPWLEWAGKREGKGFDVDALVLHIHERVSAQAILRLAAREPIQRSLFGDPELEYREAVRFYAHDVDWANRLILGDSLTVMHSLARREDLAGKVQTIYMDPPYGINFRSNFQPLVRSRDVREKDRDLTREPETVKAYRDTWTLGVHTYLGYLRDRLIVARELLRDNGSLFLQISDENLHRVRSLLDEVLGSSNFVGLITLSKTTSATAKLLSGVTDYLLWYAKDITKVKYFPQYRAKEAGGEGAAGYTKLVGSMGELRGVPKDWQGNSRVSEDIWRLAKYDNLTSDNPGSRYEVEREGGKFWPGGSSYWKTDIPGMTRLGLAGRLVCTSTTLYYLRYLDDFEAIELNNLWDDVAIGGFGDPKLFVVQTNSKIIQRCILMTTEPGDLVLDPTCGSGTTAYVAEEWGRRWITIDTSRVSIAIARQRLLTARYEYFELREPERGPGAGFFYETMPHVMLSSIAQNQALDPIFAQWEPVLAEKLESLNKALKSVTPDIRARLAVNMAEKERREGKRAITESERRRWLLPKTAWEEWEVPFDTDPEWPKALQVALVDYRKAWRGKMDEVNACIQASTPQEELVDKPRRVPGVVRVSGPFTVEGVQPGEETFEESPIGGEPEELDRFPVVEAAQEPANAEAYLEKMIRLLRQDGVRFPNNKVLTFDRLDPMVGSLLHAEGEWGNGAGGNRKRKVAVSVGPQYGPITARQVEECLREAYRRGFDDLVFAGFTFDGAAQAAIQEDQDPKVRSHLAHIRPDVNMGDLLKDTPSSQLFTVFGLPRVRAEQTKDGEWVIEMEGVDIYDPIENTIKATKADKVAAWFLDGDYDGRTFCMTQAFFPDAGAWEKLARALKTVVDSERFEAFSGTRSLPFPGGEHARAAVKVIDPRGNEAMCVVKLERARSR